MTTRSHGLLDQIENIIVHAKTISTAQISSIDSAFIQSQLARHGCVLACASLEQAIMESASNYAVRVGDIRLGGFVSEILKTGRSPFPDYVCDVMARFDPLWGRHLSDFIDAEAISDKIKSVVSNRNRIAHGEQVGVGVASLIQWTPAVRKLCLELHRLTTDAEPNRKYRAPPRRRRLDR